VRPSLEDVSIEVRPGEIVALGEGLGDDAPARKVLAALTPTRCRPVLELEVDTARLNPRPPLRGIGLSGPFERTISPGRTSI